MLRLGHGVIVASLAFFSVAGCCPSGHHSTSTYYQSYDRDGVTSGADDLILVAGDAAVPHSAITVAQRFTVAVHAVRTVPPGESSAEVLASDGGSPEAADEPLLRRSEGTGIVIDRSGLILTNHHVVHDSSDVRVWSPGSGWLTAQLVAADPISDLAVIEVAADLPVAARLGRGGDQRIGQAVAALGYAPGEPPLADRPEPTVLTGRLIGTHWSLQGALDPAHKHYYGDLLASTVELQPGHSGGALIDRTGTVVGINTAAVTHYPSGHRTGYAIPMTTQVRRVVSRLSRGQTVTHGYLGIMVRTSPADRNGVAVERVIPAGPAEIAGVQPGDRIVRLGDSPVQNAAQLAAEVRAARVGQPVPVVVQRGWRQVNLVCTPTQRPANPPTDESSRHQ